MPFAFSSLSLFLSLSLTHFLSFIFSRTTHSQLSLDISSLSFTCTCRFQLLESKAQNSPLSISFLRSRSFVSLSCTADCQLRCAQQRKMWKLKIAEGGSPWLRTLNDHVGRQVWEFDPKLGSPEQLAEIEAARENFTENRFHKKHSSDLIMRIQVYSNEYMHVFILVIEFDFLFFILMNIEILLVSKMIPFEYKFSY